MWLLRLIPQSNQARDVDINAISKQHFHVLVTEDDVVNQEVIKLLLQSFGCTVDIAENGEIAYQLQKKNQYHLIFMDCQMLVLDGFEATRKIRQWEKENNVKQGVPIVALTAHTLNKVNEDCMQAGMNDVCIKPLNRNRLFGVLKKQCRFTI